MKLMPSPISTSRPKTVKPLSMTRKDVVKPGTQYSIVLISITLDVRYQARYNENGTQMK